MPAARRRVRRVIGLTTLSAPRESPARKGWADDELDLSSPDSFIAALESANTNLGNAIAFSTTNPVSAASGAPNA
jgi:hypothetical protein